MFTALLLSALLIVVVTLNTALNVKEHGRRRGLRRSITVIVFSIGVAVTVCVLAWLSRTT